jgi:predicted DNA-binding protein (MmcQ/YjbR family)
VTDDDFNAFCSSLPATSHVIQWGGAHVWKIGGKVFAVGGWGKDGPAFTFKTSDFSYELLKEQPGLRPAPYLASRGLKWIQNYAAPGLGDEDLKLYLRHSYSLVLGGLSKKKRKDLGLDEWLNPEVSQGQPG